MLSKEQLLKQRLGAINESVIKFGDVYKVKTTVDVPKSMINAFVSKSKKEHDKDPKDIWSDIDLAEMFVNYITSTYMNIDSIPVDSIMGESETEISSEVTPSEAAANPATVVEQPTNSAETPVDNTGIQGTVENAFESNRKVKNPKKKG